MNISFIAKVYLLAGCTGSLLLCLCCCAWAFSSCVCGPLLVAVALAAEHGLQAGPASAAVARGPPGCWCSSCLCGSSCSAACGIFRDQGPNQHPLHCKSNSQPLSHQGSPEYSSVVGALLCTVGCEADPWGHNEMPVASPSSDGQKRF